MSLKAPNSAWRFPNGDYVFRSDDSQINPSSPEGIQIQAIWDYQNVLAKQTQEQQIHFAWVTYPNDPVSRANWLKSNGLDPSAPDPFPSQK